MPITDVRMQNFRSFSDETTLQFKRGLNVLVGANGVGKSNVLDALLFALTQDVSLRSRNWGELRTRSHRGPCAVALRIQPPASDETISIVAHVKDDATRLLKLNDKQATVSQVRAALRQARLEAEDTSFAIRQHAASRVLDGAHLLTLLQQASGASNFGKAVAESNVKLEKERESLRSVRTDVAALEEMLTTEHEEAAALRQLLKLRSQLKGARESRREAGGQLLAVSTAKDLAAERAVGLRLDSALEQAATLREVLRAQRDELGDAHDAAREASAAADARHSEVGEALDVALEAEVTLVDSAVQCQRRRAEVAEAEAAGEGEGEAATDGGEGAARRLQLRGARLRGRLHALKAAQAELATSAGPETPGWAGAGAEAEAEAEVEGGRAADRAADVGGLKRQRRAEAGAEHDATRPAGAELRRARLETDAATRAGAAAAVAARDAEARAQAAEVARRGAATELAALREAALTTARRAQQQPSGEDPATSQAELQRATTAAAAAAAAQKQAEERVARVVGGDIHAASGGGETGGRRGGAAPALASLLRVRDEPGMRRCLFALHVLAGRSLPVRVTSTAEQVWPVLDAARRGGRSVRVWPLDRLKPHDHTQRQRAIQAEFGPTRVVLPVDLLEFDAPFAPAVRQAVGRSLLVEDDELAAEIVRRHGVPCVSFEGTRHEKGKMQGGYHGERASSFTLLLERQQAAAAADQAGTAMREAAARLRTVQASASAARAASDACAAEERGAARVREAAEGCRAMHAAALTAQQEEAEEQQRAACAASRLAALEKAPPVEEGKSSAWWQRLQEQQRASLQAQASALQSELRGICEAAVTEGAMQQLRRLDAEAVEEQLQELALAGQQAAATLASQERVLATLEAAVREASVATASTSAAAEALSRKVLHTQEQSGAVEAAVRRAEADRLSLTERQHGASVAQVVDTDSESDGESDGGDDEDCVGNDGNGGNGGNAGGGGGGGGGLGLGLSGGGSGGVLGDAVEADEAGDGDPPGVDDSGGSGRGGGRKRGGVALATGAGPGEQAALESRVEEIQLEVRVLSRKKQDLEQVHGGLQQLRRRLRAQGGATGLVTRLTGLQRKEETIQKSIANLHEGIEVMTERVLQADLSAFTSVREELLSIFSSLVPTKQLAIECVDPSCVSAGLTFKLRNRAPTGGAGAGAGESDGGEAWREGLDELSGGQNTLLNVSALLAVAKFRPSLVLLMDEIDAALDEHNTQRVARLLKALSQHTQVIAISHHREFHEVADHIVRLHAADGRTVATYDR